MSLISDQVETLGTSAHLLHEHDLALRQPSKYDAVDVGAIKALVNWTGCKHIADFRTEQTHPS